MITLGIDFGTCFSSAAFMRDGVLHRVKDPVRHSYSWPSSVYLEDSGRLLVGFAAEMKRKLKPSRYKREFKRDFGETAPYILGDRSFFPEELTTELLVHLRVEAEAMNGGERILSAAVTLPVTFGDRKAELLRGAAKAAGFEHVFLVREPVAAATYFFEVGHSPRMLNEGEFMLVYDLGGGTFDAALVTRAEDGFSIVGEPIGVAHCGGADFDRLILHDILEKCGENARTTVAQQGEMALRTQAFLLENAVNVKHQLSAASKGEDLVQVPQLGLALEYELDEAKFNQMIAPLLDETIRVCNDLVGRNNIVWDQIAFILLVGGSCRLPTVANTMLNAFQRPVIRVDEPELAVCLGAAPSIRPIFVQALARVRELQTLSEVIVASIKARVDLLRLKTHSRITKFLFDFAATVGNDMQKFEPKTKMIDVKSLYSANVSALALKKDRESFERDVIAAKEADKQLGSEIVSQMHKIQGEKFALWFREQLQPEIDKCISFILLFNQRDVEAFISMIDNIGGKLIDCKAISASILQPAELQCAFDNFARSASELGSLSAGQKWGQDISKIYLPGGPLLRLVLGSFGIAPLLSPLNSEMQPWIKDIETMQQKVDRFSRDAGRGVRDEAQKYTDCVIAHVEPVSERIAKGFDTAIQAVRCELNSILAELGNGK